MSPRPITHVLIASLSVAILWSSQMIQFVQSRDCSILNVYGENGKIGAGFGVDKSGRVPHSGSGGDAGADATLFNPGSNPHPVCGEVAILHGDVNIPDQTAKSVAQGVPSVFKNGSIPMDFFQVNRNGGGPVLCEVSTDGTGNSFEPMDMTFNAPGNFGLFPANRKTYRIVATFKEGTACNGGATKNLCMVRCRAGQDPNKQHGICGGCFVVQLNGKVVRANGSGSSSSSSSSSGGYTLTSQQMDSLISVTVQLAKQNNLVEHQHKKRGHHQ